MRVVDCTDFWFCPDGVYAAIHREEMASFVPLFELEDDPGTWQLCDDDPVELSGIVWVCPSCGWWVASKQVSLDTRCQIWDLHFAARGELRTLDIGEVQASLDETRAFLAAKYDSRFGVNPRTMEEVVASVFRDQGYTSLVTAYSRDGGIDVVLRGPNDERIGVQVKRYKDSIEVEQIRAFVGALSLGKYVKGIFVTTSRYQCGCKAIADQSEVMGIPIELIDENAFYDAIRAAQINGGDPVPEVLEMLRAQVDLNRYFVGEDCRNPL